MINFLRASLLDVIGWYQIYFDLPRKSWNPICVRLVTLKGKKETILKTAVESGPSWNSRDDGVEMVTHTQQQAVIGTWVE